MQHVWGNEISECSGALKVLSPIHSRCEAINLTVDIEKL